MNFQLIPHVKNVIGDVVDLETTDGTTVHGRVMTATLSIIRMNIDGVDRTVPLDSVVSVHLAEAA